MIERASVLDTISELMDGDVCLILPTLRHAGVLWPVYRQAIEDRFNGRSIHRTKTSIVISGERPRVLRLWVPYSRDPTQPLDWEFNRQGFVFVSPYAERDLGI